MSWFSKFFLNSKSTDTLVDAAVKTGDKLFYTQEEKAENKQKYLEWYLDLLDSMKPFNVAMRALALGVFAVWVIHLLGSTGFYVAAFFNCEPNAPVCMAARAGDFLDNQLSTHINKHFADIMMFYFVPAGTAGVVNGAIRTHHDKKR